MYFVEIITDSADESITLSFDSLDSAERFFFAVGSANDLFRVTITDETEKVIRRYHKKID
jgi:hypothetical protein